MHVVDPILVFYAYLIDKLLFAREDIDCGEDFRVTDGEAERVGAIGDAIEAMWVCRYGTCVISREVGECGIVVSWHHVESDGVVSDYLGTVELCPRLAPSVAEEELAVRSAVEVSLEVSVNVTGASFRLCGCAVELGIEAVCAEEDDVGIGRGILVEHIRQAEVEEVVGIGKEKPLACSRLDALVASRSCPLALLAENEFYILTVVAGKVVKIDNGGVAIVIHDDDLEVFSHGYRRQATLEQVGNVVVWNYDGKSGRHLVS